MNKKTIIQLVIIVVAFGAAGLILYNGFFNGGGTPSAGIVGGPGGISQSASTSAQGILPYGSVLDFSKALDINRFQYNQITYPQLDPQNDVGVSPNNLVTPAPAIQSAQSP